MLRASLEQPLGPQASGTGYRAYLRAGPDPLVKGTASAKSMPPPRFELGLLGSQPRVLTTRLWKRHVFQKWRIGVSIPVPRRCERRTLPIELIPLTIVDTPHRSVTLPPLTAKSASGEFRSPDLWAMNPTRCQLRYGGSVREGRRPAGQRPAPNSVPNPRLLPKECVIRESNPGPNVGNVRS